MNVTPVGPVVPPRGRSFLVVRVCKPGLAVLAVAYVLLTLSSLLALLNPPSVGPKVAALVAYLLLAGLAAVKYAKSVTALNRRR